MHGEIDSVACRQIETLPETIALPINALWRDGLIGFFQKRPAPQGWRSEAHLPAINAMVALREEFPSSLLNTSLGTRTRISGETALVNVREVALPSQQLIPPANPVLFRHYITGVHQKAAFQDGQFGGLRRPEDSFVSWLTHSDLLRRLMDFWQSECA